MFGHHGQTTVRRLTVIVLLCVSGAILAKLTQPLLYGAELVFFSLPAWYALRRLSLNAAMGVALASAAAAVFVWGASPLYALFPLEVLLVGWLMQKRIRSLIIADFIYWVLLGIWLVGFGYHHLTDGESPYLALFVLILMLNGLLCTVIGEIAANYLPLRMPGEPKTRRRISLENASFHYTAGLLALPLVIFFALSTWLHEYHDPIALRAERFTASVNDYINRLSVTELRDLKVRSGLQKAHLHSLFRQLAPGDDATFILTDADDRVIVANSSEPAEGDSYDWTSGGAVSQLGADVHLWLPDGVPAYNSISRWAKGDFVTVNELDGVPFRLIIRQPAAQPQATVFDLYFTALLVTFLLIGIALLAITRMMKRFTGEITQLGRFSSDLPKKIAEGAPLDWTGSRMAELDLLKRNMADTAAVLDMMFRERKAKEAELMQLAHKDPLTVLDNRHSFNHYMDQELARAKEAGERVACLFIDFDELKTVNDTYGHEAGDAVLIAVGDQLKSLENDHIRSFRLAGDEFVMVAGEPLPPDLGRWAEDVRRLLSSRTVTINGRAIALHTSIGLAVFPDDGEEADALLRHSDRAMYRSKQAARVPREVDR